MGEKTEQKSNPTSGKPHCGLCGHPIENLAHPHFHMDPHTGLLLEATDHIIYKAEPK